MSVNTCYIPLLLLIVDTCRFTTLLQLSNYNLDLESSGSTNEQRGLEQESSYESQLNSSRIKITYIIMSNLI